MDDPEYSCPVEELPYAYPEWNPKWYSPLCRPWLKEQKSAPDQNTLSDLYIQANEQAFGMTACAPISEQDKSLFGALCLDMNPSGPLQNYYPFSETEYATYLLFNNDAEFDSITDIGDSKFRDYIETIIGAKVKDFRNYDTFEITELLAWSKQARIYNNEELTWGKVSFKLGVTEANENPDLEDIEASYWFIIDDIIVDFRA